VEKQGNDLYVQLGERAAIDEGVVLGYPPSRGNEQLLIIGPGARLRYGTIIYGGSRIGQKLETGHNVIIREQNTIGDHFCIWSNSVVDYGCVIGNNVKIHTNVYIAQYTVIEDDVFLAPGVNLANDIHPGCPDSKECMRGPVIKRGAQIGINVCILPRVIVGEHAVIGAGSIVTKDIPAGTVAFGNPARVVCRIEDINCTFGLRDKPYSAIVIS
jgi:acetyltransferase-like isoleucine patch superfamily enzyme